MRICLQNLGVETTKLASKYTEPQNNLSTYLTYRTMFCISEQLSTPKLHNYAINLSFCSKKTFQTYLAKLKGNNIGLLFEAFWCLWKNFNNIGKKRD